MAVSLLRITLILACAWAASGLATTHKWKQMNDPVMSAKSTGTVELENGIFDGKDVDVPLLKAPFVIVDKADVADFKPLGRIIPDSTGCKVRYDQQVCPPHDGPCAWVIGGHTDTPHDIEWQASVREQAPLEAQNNGLLELQKGQVHEADRNNESDASQHGLAQLEDEGRQERLQADTEASQFGRVASPQGPIMIVAFTVVKVAAVMLAVWTQADRARALGDVVVARFVFRTISVRVRAPFNLIMQALAPVPAAAEALAAQSLAAVPAPTEALAAQSLVAVPAPAEAPRVQRPRPRPKEWLDRALQLKIWGCPSVERFRQGPSGRLTDILQEIHERRR